jgi:chromate transporter
MHAELVEKKSWISESRFLHALNYCMLLPGPEAQQLAIYVGWLLHRTRGGIVAGVFFVLPSMAILWTLSVVYALYGDLAFVTALFAGIKPTVIAIVAVAVLRIGARALRNRIMWGVATVSFLSIFFFDVPFPAIILSAGALGLLGNRLLPGSFSPPVKANTSTSVLDDAHESPEHARPSGPRLLKILVVCLLLWWTPVLLIAYWQSPQSTLFIEGIFFSKAAMITFGGAYAVLPYVAQQVVEKYGWLQPGQMLDGLGLAETTPGPLIMVVQFVGFMAAWNNPGNLPPLMAATLGAMITTWVTFLPCFLWILAGAPYIESLRGSKHLSAALSVVTAAVVGVVLNLAVWFALHVLLPGPGRIDWFAFLVAAAAFVGMVRWKWDVVWVVIGGGLVGLTHALVLFLSSQPI